jgi:hopanoid biosynthesis associated protein HpnK
MQVIFNADDFGRSSSINAAIIQAHRKGILTSASMMAAGEAFEEAVALARQVPNLAVGLHIVLVNGKSVLPHSAIPHLVDELGNFPTDPFAAGVRYFIDPSSRREVRGEIQAQFERFKSAGLSLSHVDGHLHMHMHPAIFPVLLPMAVEYGARGMRIPQDDVWLSLKYERRRVLLRLAWGLYFGAMSRWSRPRLAKTSLVSTKRVFGLMQSGAMHEDYVMLALESLRLGPVEMYFHPDCAGQGESFGPNSGDLQALLSPKIRSFVEQRGFDRTTYPELAETMKAGRNDRY